jgi:hypothetical protein
VIGAANNECVGGITRIIQPVEFQQINQFGYETKIILEIWEMFPNRNI